MANKTWKVDRKKAFEQAKAAIANGTKKTTANTEPTAAKASYSDLKNLAPAASSVVGGMAMFSAPARKTTYTKAVNTNNQPYVDQLNKLYGQYMNRGPFQYDLQSDMLYKQMADQYTTKGQQAMMDTMGQAAALTGGYGNSFAQGVGNQAYQQYLMALNEQVPALYQQAYNVWQDEGDRLLQQYNLASQHPGILEALAPRSYTYTVEEKENAGGQQSYQQLLKRMLSSTQDKEAANALTNWYYQLLNTK